MAQLGSIPAVIPLWTRLYNIATMWGNTELASKKQLVLVRERFLLSRIKSESSPTAKEKEIVPKYKLVLVPATWRKSQNDRIIWVGRDLLKVIYSSSPAMNRDIYRKIIAYWNSISLQMRQDSTGKLFKQKLWIWLSWDVSKTEEKEGREWYLDCVLTENQVNVDHWSLGIQTSKTHRKNMEDRVQWSKFPLSDTQ